MKTINDYAELVKEKHALNKTIAPVETDLTDASREYHIGEQFIINGGLFKAKTEIAQHDALVLNTNYEPADNLTEQIKNAGGGTGTDPRLDVFENNIAPVETDETDASRAYQVGEQLILDNILYDVIAPVSEHDVITTTGSGANIAPADPISSQFQTLTQKTDNTDTVITKNGAVNYAPNTAASETVSNVTFTIDTSNTDSKGTVALSGTASEAITKVLGKFKVPVGRYILSSKADGSKARVTVEAYNGTTWKRLLASTASSDDVAFNADFSDYDTLWISVRVDSGVNVSDVVVKPMVSIVAGDYAPYAMTNRELTPTLLWSNSTPTSDFAGASVTLSQAFTNFKFLEIFYAEKSGSYQGSIKVVSKSGGAAVLKDYVLTDSLAQLRTRFATPNDTNKITFGDGYVCNLSSGATVGTLNNAVCIPLEVYGIK